MSWPTNPRPVRRVRLRVQRRRTWWDRLLRRPDRWDDQGVHTVEPWPDQRFVRDAIPLDDDGTGFAEYRPGPWRAES